MSTPEKNGNSPESLGSAPKSPVESVKNRLDQVAAKNGDPKFAESASSFMARLATLPDTEKANVAKEMEAILLQAEHDNMKIGPQFFMACEALLSGKIG